MRPDESIDEQEAERALLGALLLNDHLLASVTSVLGAEDFALPSHGLIFEVLRQLHGQGEAIDIVTVVSALRARERLQTVGGPSYLSELQEVAATTPHVESYARIIREAAVRRSAAKHLHEGLLQLRSGHAWEAVRQNVTRALSNLSSSAAAPAVSADLEHLFETSLARANGTDTPLKTPWPLTNERLGGGGFWPGMYVLVGNTGAGKSQWAVQYAVHAARTGIPVLYLALELSRRDLAARVVGAVTGAPWSRLLLGRMTEPELHEVFGRAEPLIRRMPLHSECGVPYGYGVETLVQRAWALRPKLIVLDYLQVCGGRAGEEPRVTVGKVSYAARALARDLDAVVLVLSSTARTNYETLVCNHDTDPASLVGLGKESGEIEYAADGVLVLARDRSLGDVRARSLIVAKNRYGELGRVGLHWNGTAFRELEEPQNTPVPPLEDREDQEHKEGSEL